MGVKTSLALKGDNILHVFGRMCSEQRQNLRWAKKVNTFEHDVTS